MRWPGVLGAVALLMCCAASSAAPQLAGGVLAWGGADCSRRAACGIPTLRLRGGSLANLAAYMLLKMGGKAEPSADDVKKVLDSVGAKVEMDVIEKACTELKGKDINKLIEEGKLKAAEADRLLALAQGVGGGGGGGGGGAAAAAGKKEEDNAKGGKKEEKEEEKEKEPSSLGGGSDDDMGFGLFD